MSQFLERFREKTAKWFTTKDGLVDYRVCAITAAQGEAAVDALLEMAKWVVEEIDHPEAVIADDNDMEALRAAAVLTDAEKEERKSRIRMIVRSGLLAARMDGVEYPAPPIDEIPGPHLGEIAKAILAAGVPSTEAAEGAGRVL